MNNNNSEPIPAGLVSIKKAAAYLDCSERSVYRLIAERVLPKLKVRGRSCIAFKDLESYVDRLRRERTS